MGYLHKNIQFQKSIYFKIMLLGIAVVAIFGVFLMTTYQMSTEQLEKEITSNAEALSQQLRQNISSRLNVMENNGFLSVDLSKNFSDNLDVLNNSGDTSERLKARFEIGKVLENWPYNQHQILWTAVLDNNGNVYARGCEKLPSRKKLTEIFERADYDRCYSVPGKTMWLSDGNGGIILIRAIFHMDKLEFCGYVMADLKIDDIEELFLSNDLWIMKNPYYFLLGTGIGLLDALPVLGTGTVLIPWAAADFFMGNWKGGLALLVLYGVCYFLREILEARMMGSQVGLSPLENLMAMYVGLELFGIAGFFLGPLGLLLIEDLTEAVYRDS